MPLLTHIANFVKYEKPRLIPFEFFPTVDHTGNDAKITVLEPNKFSKNSYL